MMWESLTQIEGGNRSKSKRAVTVVRECMGVADYRRLNLRLCGEVDLSRGTNKDVETQSGQP